VACWSLVISSFEYRRGFGRGWAWLTAWLNMIGQVTITGGINIAAAIYLIGAATRIFGWSADEVIGKAVTIIIPADRLQEEPRILSRLRSGVKGHFSYRKIAWEMKQALEQQDPVLGALIEATPPWIEDPLKR